jgi:hypothetical protein
MMVFLGILVVGFIYEWKKGALGLAVKAASFNVSACRRG